MNQNQTQNSSENRAADQDVQAALDENVDAFLATLDVDQSQTQNPRQSRAADQDVQAALDEENVATIPVTLENDACEIQPVDGRGLFHFSTFKDASRRKRNREPDIDLNPRVQRKLRVDNEGAVNRKWVEIKESRRKWNSTAHQWWSPPWEGSKRKVQPFDVFCNDDEVHYTWQNFPQYSEDAIRMRYRVGHWRDLKDKSEFIKEARRINHSKGYRYRINEWKPYFFREQNKGDSKSISKTLYNNDIKYMKSLFGEEVGTEGKWWYGGKLGGGTYGTALRYDFIDQNNAIKERIVVKRDNYHMFSNDLERAIGAKLKGKSRYILNYLTPGSRAAQGQKGITYTELAAYGDLSKLFLYYSHYKWILPEEFCWYLLHCLAEASYVLENGVPPKSGESGGDALSSNGTNGWKPMFHFDLKPGNIFLDHPAKDYAYWWQRNYPVPIMADLGGAARYPNDQSCQPFLFHCPVTRNSKKYDYPYSEIMDVENHHVAGAGTHGYQPFELLRKGEQKQANIRRQQANLSGAADAAVPTLPERQPIRIHTTIYQIGCVLYRGMTNMTNYANLGQLWYHEGRVDPSSGEDGWVKDPQQDYQRRHQTRFPGTRFRRPGKNSDRTDEKPYSPERALLPHYSHKLVDLVYKCMHPLHDQRPTPKELWDETNAMMEEYDRIWPKPDPNNPTAAAGSGQDNDDDLEDLDVDYRSEDQEGVSSEVDVRQEKVTTDPRGDEMYESIREQYVDVEPECVPIIWRSMHKASSFMDPVVREWRYGREAGRRRRRAKRDVEYAETLRIINDKKAYKARLAENEEQCIDRLRRARGARNWERLSEGERNRRKAAFRAEFAKQQRKAKKHIFEDQEIEDFDENAPLPERPRTPDEDGDNDKNDQEDQEEVRRFLNDENRTTPPAGPTGKLLHHGPRMVSLPWEFQPLGAKVLTRSQYSIPKGRIFQSAPVEDPYGELSADQSTDESSA